MKKYYILILTLLISSTGLLAQTATTSSYKSIITAIYMQAAMTGIILAVLTMIIVSIKDYDLIDNRIRNQKDVFTRRIIFFILILLLPTIWFFTTGNFMYNAISCTIMSYNWSPDDSWIGTKLLSAYTVAGTIMLTSCYLIFYVLISWIWAKFLHRYKAWTVIYSNHKIFGKISLNKINK